MHRLPFCAALLLFLASAALASDAWTQFRGPDGQGDSDSTGLPTTWSESSNIRWKTAIHGKAWSTPVVMDGKVWLTSATEDGTQLFLLCVDAESGKILQDAKLFSIANPQYCIPFNSYASPSPAIEPGRLYVTFGSPGTACIDTATGQVLWTRTDIACNHYRGAGSSPVIFQNLLIMNFDGSDHQFVLALDKATGKTVWETKRSVDYQDLGPDGQPERSGDWRKAFSTPRIATFNGKDLLLSLGSKCFYAYDPATGRELWRVENRSTHSGSVTPVVGKDLIYACMGIGKAQLFAIRPDGTIAWKASRNIPTRPSPLLVDGLIYMVDEGGIATCIDAQTGQDVWRQRLGGKEYSASPAFADGKLYFLSQEGRTTVVAPGRTFKKLADNDLENGFMASPAVAGKALYLRTRTHLYRVEQASR